MSAGVTALLVAAGVGVGIAIGVHMTKSAVESGAVGAADSVIRAIGGDPLTGYGRVAHTIIDQFATGALNG
jgi:hypothetical protein